MGKAMNVLTIAPRNFPDSAQAYIEALNYGGRQ